MSFSQALKVYYPLFGIRGVCIAALARLARRYPRIPVTVDGIDKEIYIRWRTTDVSVFRQVFVVGEYSCDVPRSPEVIVDAGANIGLTSILFANRFPSAKIFAVEPATSNFKILLKNVRKYPNITALQAALWSTTTKLHLVDPGLGHHGFRTHPITDAGAEQQVEALPVPEVMKKFDLARVDLLKMDIEGAEEEVLGNCASWIDRVGTVVVETHDRFRPHSSEVVFRALSDFDVRWQIGETLYFTRSTLLPTQFRPGSFSPAFRGHRIGPFTRAE